MGGKRGSEQYEKIQERRRRWRLILGADQQEGSKSERVRLSAPDAAMDRALQQLYDQEAEGGLGDSRPDIARWLGDIREYFPAQVVRVMQQDALDRLKLRQMLLEPELLSQIEPDVRLVADILALQKVMPRRTRESARQVVRQVVEQLQKKLQNPLREAVTGSLNRTRRNRNPRHSEINWDWTIRANLKHYQAEYQSIIPQQMIGYGRRRSQLRDVVLLIDQSGSMATSVVYAGVLGSALASLPALNTRLVMFDTNVVDLSEQLTDPVELLFGVRLGGGTDINRAVTYAQRLIERPRETILILISDLFEGGDREEMVGRINDLVTAGVQVVALLALNDQGKPSFDRQLAAELASLGVPAFGCTPEIFPELMAAAIGRRNIGQWAAAQGIVTAPSN